MDATAIVLSARLALLTLLLLLPPAILAAHWLAVTPRKSKAMD
jgi:ABC-type molybdate transport system permease subunit